MLCVLCSSHTRLFIIPQNCYILPIYMTLLMLFSFPEILFLPIPGQCPTQISPALFYSLWFIYSQAVELFHVSVTEICTFVREFKTLCYTDLFLCVYFQIDSKCTKDSDRSSTPTIVGEIYLEPKFNSAI